MDLLRKVEVLLNATTRSKLPRRRRRRALDEEEEQLLTEIRQALAAVEAQERLLAKRIKAEQAQAKEAAQLGNHSEQRAHERRASELERELEEESIQAIDLEEKLQALEEKLALAREAVERQVEIFEAMEEEATQEMAHEDRDLQTDVSSTGAATEKKATPADARDDGPDIDTRKARLSG
jgi:hypothetical protein